MDVVNAEVFELPQLFHNQFRRPNPGGKLVADMLDAIGASGRTAAARDDEGEWPLDQRHAVEGIQRETYGINQFVKICAAI